MQFIYKIERLNSIMHCCNFCRVLMIFFNNCLTSQVRNRNDMVGCIHTLFLDTIDIRVDIATATVVVGSMHVNNHRFATDAFSKYTCWICQPVVRVDDIEIERVRQHTCYGFVVANLFEKVVRITT